MQKKIGIFGSSGMAREVGDIAIELGYVPLFIEKDDHGLQDWDSPFELITESEFIRCSGLPCVVGIGQGAIRRKIVTRFSAKRIFPNLIHPSATFGSGQKESLEQQYGVVVCAGVRFTNNIKVGNFTIFNLNTTISHDSLVEDFVTVSPGATILGNVHIKSGAWIGAGAVVNQGSNESKLIVGENSVIGSGAVVVKDCDPNSTYVGVPARRIR